MEQDLRNLFKEFKFCTLECIKNLQNDYFDDFNKLMTKRQHILDKISIIKTDYNNLAKELDILTYEKILIDLIQEKKIEIRSKIDNIEKNKMASSSYNKRSMNSAVFFSKKI